MNIHDPSPNPAVVIVPGGNEQMQEKECIALEDKSLTAVQILSAQTHQAQERSDSTPLFIP